jgi:hypothetical protein
MSSGCSQPSGIWRSPPRRGIAVLALLAVALFLLGPVCPALQTAHAHAGQQADAGPAPEHPDACCTSLDDAAVLPGSAATLTADPGFAEFAAPVAQVARIVVPASIAVRYDPPRNPPRSLPYHTRTTRILA